jgi:hypothetical protein
MQALVGRHVDIAERAITSAEASTNQRNAVATALVQTHRDEFDCRAPASGILVAFAENPNLLEPVRVHQRRVVERIRASASHPELSMIAFLALEGLKILDVFETNALTGGERERVLDTLLRRLADA